MASKVKYPEPAWLTSGDMSIDVQCVRDGYAAERAHEQERNCPHPEGAPERDGWLWGWHTARAFGLPERPKRRMPRMTAIVRHHGLPGTYCLQCGYVGSLERAHIIDRTTGGLDHAGNLAPLCAVCHRTQPIFGPGQEAEALRWFGLLMEDAPPEVAKRLQGLAA